MSVILAAQVQLSRLNGAALPALLGLSSRAGLAEAAKVKGIPYVVFS